MTTISRKQLKLLGASDYLARRLTEELPVAKKVGRAFAYAIESVLSSIDSYGQRSVRIRTRQILATLKLALQQQTSEVEDVSDPMHVLAADILSNHTALEDAIAASKQGEADFYNAHSQWIEQNLIKKNNIVIFSGVR
ncbi:hypothetical protein IQ260_25230 [Leptolyngbya cf. ectocarpi LEGE 11479]|uniref:Uncharacterized protein n=1 Tax=Leptolyngbya cf. ectocarpi LEGE 11479 TaxID=1828722 RepID=A0A928ZYQ0_LEPEC|nr:hypothetical protein [Leptolyngbya ectocarpi]MBE9069949.1 hypothetical protein [Leptolyngbya cf. ectocarpi LEGE 11479]